MEACSACGRAAAGPRSAQHRMRTKWVHHWCSALWPVKGCAAPQLARDVGWAWRLSELAGLVTARCGPRSLRLVATHGGPWLCTLLPKVRWESPRGPVLEPGRVVERLRVSQQASVETVGELQTAPTGQ
ncbi:hypothetical protein NDU88_003172 [Pleurodeles waltl]|uniref:Uncharacterized protein n=1 Tax=Pleurodeles waltl TaxID=8319 RepID=A0AAV7M2N8_PLEWA|nr:hypothetical protein NDU88_003171 [Pleurodeles waltl]KAJ1098056.1 hypothetical protein NDU88_003172 [Pleurodeles waltl]